MQEKFSHAIPLILFTTLLPVAMGLEIGAALAVCTGEINTSTLRPILYWSGGFSILAAVLVSLHLGRPTKGPTSLRGVLHSCLSREIVFGGCFAGLLFVSIVVAHTAPENSLLTVLLVCTGIFGLATSFVIGRVYDLATQLSWRGLVPSLGSVLASLLTALLILLMLNRDAEQITSVRNYFYLVLILDAFFSVMKLQNYLHLKRNSNILTYPRYQTLVILCLGGKLPLAAIVLFVMQKPFLITFSLIGLLIVLDRIAFYASAARRTPRSNIAGAKDQRMQAALNSKAND